MFSWASISLELSTDERAVVKNQAQTDFLLSIDFFPIFVK
jgi:hypothetical protein